MSIIFKKLLITTFFLLILPLGVLLSGWQWSPNIFQYDIRFLYWITETASSPWALITCFIFLLLAIWSLRSYSKDNIIKLTILLALSVIIGQGIKSVTKSIFDEPRPFVMWLEETYQIDDEYFYSLPRKERAAILNEHVKNDSSVPPLVLYHWKNETGYSLPSGHALFAASWLFLFVGLLSINRHKIIITFIAFWTFLILLSRLLLGMHWPSDLIGGTFLALLISIVACYFAKRWHLIADN